MGLAQQDRVRHWALIAALPLAACTGDLVDITGPRSDASAAADASGASDDLAGGGDPDGGTTATVHFNPDIEKDIEAKGCTLGACHGGTQIPVLKNGAVNDNYTAFKAEAMQGENSPVLLKNLSGSGVSHTGGSAFASKADPVYVRWLAWINGGNAP
jgi:hypothetical protein